MATTPKKLTDKQLAFAIWLAQPAAVRVPKTMNELAVALGSSRQSLWRWAQDPRILEAARLVVLQNAGDPDNIKQVLDMLKEVALEKKDPKTAEIWLKAVGVMSLHSNRDLALWDQVTDEALDALSDEQLAALAAARELELQEQATIQSAKMKLGTA
jgi:hypothetical protein